MHRFRQRRTARTGFTLAELLVTISIIGLLAAVAIPLYGAATRNADLGVARSEVRKSVTAVETMLLQVQSLGSGASITQTPSTGTPTALNLVNPNGLPTIVTLPVAMTAGSSLNTVNAVNNVVKGVHSYCLAVSYNGRSVFHGPNGPVTDCFTNSTTPGAGTTVAGTDVNLALNPSFTTPGTPVGARTNLYADPAAAGSVSNFPQSGSNVAASISTIATDNPHSGLTSLKREITGAGTIGAAAKPQSPIFLLAGEDVSWSVWVFSTRAGGVNLYGDSTKTVDGTYTGISAGGAAIPANTWTRVSGRGIAGVDLSIRQIGVYNLTVQPGDTVWLDDFIIEKGPVVGSYFDGATAAAGDYTYEWLGASNASASTQRGLAAAGVNQAGDAVAVRSSAWAATGTTSVHVVPKTSINNSFAYMSTTFTAGRTYTVLAKVRLQAPQTGTLHARARGIYVQGSAANAFAAAPNAAGTHQLRLVFTATASTSNLFLYSGATAGNGDVWFDDVLVAEGEYDGDYFDGDTSGATWSGTPGNSASTRTY